MTINDPIFGNMEYDCEWEKKEQISLWNKIYNVQIIVQSEDDADDSISKVQRDAYIFFKEKFSEMAEHGLSELVSYCKTILEFKSCSEKTFFESSTPIAIFFAINGDWGILFDSRFDEENGIALMFSGDHWKVGPQDILI